MGKRETYYYVAVFVRGFSPLLLLHPFLFALSPCVSLFFWGAFVSLSFWKRPFGRASKGKQRQPASCLAPPAAFACLQKIANGQHDPRVSPLSTTTVHQREWVSVLNTVKKKKKKKGKTPPSSLSILNQNQHYTSTYSLPSMVVKKNHNKK